MNESGAMLHKLADKIHGERPVSQPSLPEEHEVVRSAMQSFMNQKRENEELRRRVHDNEITIARLDVELETRIHDLNECRRERDHYMAYSWRLVTQLNAAEQLIRDALDMAKEAKLEPETKLPDMVIADPLPPMPEPLAATEDRS